MKDTRNVDHSRIRSPRVDEIRIRRTTEMHHEPFLPAGNYAQEKRPMRRSSLSPPVEPEMSGRIINGHRRGGSIERGLFLDHGHRRGTSMERGIFIDGRDDSRSPTFVKSLKWSHTDEEEILFRERRLPRDVLIDGQNNSRLLMPEYRTLNGEGSPRLMHFGGSGPSGSRFIHDKDLRGCAYLPHQVIGPTFNAGPSGGNFPSSSTGNLSNRLRDDEELQFRNNLRSNKIIVREEDQILLHSRNVYDPMLVSSHPKDFDSLTSGVSNSQDSLQLHGYGKREAIGSDGYSHAPSFEFERDPRVFSDELAFYNRDPRSYARGEHQEFDYHEHGRREEGNPRYWSEIYRKERPIEQGAYTKRDMFRPSLSRSVVDEVQYIENSRRNLRESSSRGYYSLQGEPPSNYGDIKSNTRATDGDREYIGSGSNIFGMKPISTFGRTHAGGDYGFGREAGPLPYKERSKRSKVPESDPNRHRNDVSPLRKVKAEEVIIYEPTERLHKRRYPIDEEISRHNDRIMPISDRVISRQVQELSYSDDHCTDEHLSSLSSSKRLRFDHLHHRKSGRPYEERISSRVSASNDFILSHDLPGRLHRRSIDNFPTGDRNMDIKGRLRPCTSNHRDPYPMEKRHDFYRSDRSWKRDRDGQYDVEPSDDGNPLEDWDTPIKPDLPEDSDEFKKLVDSLFLQYCKWVNTKPSTRRRYTEQGNAGILLCIVCGRLSKEFMDTRCLVTHTFMSRKVGKRAHHLALHRAICVLMGWKSVVTLTGACVYEVLPETEALTLKEDLILWPPLVIIHNSAILDNNSEGREVITIEDMESILRGMGFSGGKTKVRHGSHGSLGRSANQSILVVKFLPTFPGLQEAEKLHKYYLEKKRGREEFQKLSSNDCDRLSDVAEGLPDKKMEHVLYGYMAIAEDIDKLDFDTKKKCVVKSKKGIQAIVDAPLTSK